LGGGEGCEAFAASRDAREAILWRRLLIAGTVIEAAMLLATALIHFALTDAVDQGVTGDATRALNMLDGDSWIAPLLIG
jgi:hypothetical protein